MQKILIFLVIAVDQEAECDVHLASVEQADEQ
jgi:hypothetical protein